MSAQKEDFLIQIRDILRKEGVKLWTSPYYSDTSGVSETHLTNLSKRIAETLHLPVETCLDILKELQTNSLENLKHKSQYEQSGLATLKIKVVSHGKPSCVLTKELLLSSRGIDLKEQICQDVSLHVDKLKLISAGRVLIDKDSLGSQNVKNGQQILAVVLADSPESVQEKENILKELETVKTDSQLLATDTKYMKLEDQFGNAVKIPQAERTALIVALTLHEKGRASLKRDDYSTALVYFLEADEKFRTCSSALLSTVDNYALLDLDIAWCYMCLQSFTHLPEAQTRLERCHDKFSKTYGANLERVIALKGTAGNEACLLARLHLLQAVLLYHQNKRSESLNLLKTVQRELQDLRVNEESITALAELGFSTAEARLGLRATGGDVNLAANYINESRQTRYESRKKALAEEILQKERQKLGKCEDGKQYVDPNFVKLLVNMGYNKESARVALKKCNNVISESVEYIQDNPCTAGPSKSRSCEFKALIDDLVPQLVEAGFDPRMAKIALQKYEGDIIRSAEELLTNDGIVAGDLSQFDIRQESVEKIKLLQTKKEDEKKRAFDRLKDDLSIVDDDHLDISLIQEEVFLNQYLSLLEKR